MRRRVLVSLLCALFFTTGCEPVQAPAERANYPVRVAFVDFHNAPVTLRINGEVVVDETLTVPAGSSNGLALVRPCVLSAENDFELSLGGAPILRRRVLANDATRIVYIVFGPEGNSTIVTSNSDVIQLD